MFVGADYRSAVSGILPVHMQAAMGFKQAQEEIDALIHDRILVGHALSHDFEVMLLSHPRQKIRDTSRYKPLCPQRPRALKALASEELGLDMQQGAHDSVIDARVAMAIYTKHRIEWERTLQARPARSDSSASAVSAASVASAAAKRPKIHDRERK